MSSINTMMVKSTIMRNLNFDDVTVTSKGGKSAAEKFKLALKLAYNQPEGGDGKLFDMATGVRLRHSTVVASHIFQRRWWACLSIYSKLTDINDIRNGLLLYKPVEWAFDRAQLCVERSGGFMRFRLLDPTLKNMKLTDMAKELRLASKRSETLDDIEADLQTTFGDLDGREVFFPPDCTMRPSKRLVMWHAIASWLEHRKSVSNTARPVCQSGSDVSDDEETRAWMDLIEATWPVSRSSQLLCDAQGSHL
jgi:hypothetical protein